VAVEAGIGCILDPDRANAKWANTPMFASPEPRRLSIESPRPAPDVAAALQEAASSRRYSVPHGAARSYLRLGGAVSAAGVELTAKPYVMPGIRAGGGWLTLYFTGRIEETPDGSLLTGLVSAPIGRSVPLILAGWVAFLAVVAAAIAPVLWVGLFIIALILVPIWGLMFRYNQRAMIRQAHEFEDFLRSIVGAVGSGSTQS
jgi:hypothetical protein